MVKISRRSDGGKSTKMSFKNVRYGSQKTVSNYLKVIMGLRDSTVFDNCNVNKIRAVRGLYIISTIKYV